MMVIIQYKWCAKIAGRLISVFVCSAILCSAILCCFLPPFSAFCFLALSDCLSADYQRVRHFGDNSGANRVALILLYYLYVLPVCITCMYYLYCMYYQSLQNISIKYINLYDIKI